MGDGNRWQKARFRNTAAYFTRPAQQYADCLASREIDAVYITLPNHMHRAYAETAARAGVHVLCEKPLAVSVAEGEAIIEASKAAGVKLMTAYRLHFEKGNLTSAQWLREGKVGDPRILLSIFTQQVEKSNSRLKDETRGGPLYDMGIYCITRCAPRFQRHRNFILPLTASPDTYAETAKAANARE